MKKTLKIISTVSIVLFGILWILSKFDFLTEYNSTDFRTFLVLLYLFTSLNYFKREVKDKNTEIQELKLKLEKMKKSNLQ
jgi:Gpi18-like mannosyltransferase